MSPRKLTVDVRPESGGAPLLQVRNDDAIVSRDPDELEAAISALSDALNLALNARVMVKKKEVLS